MCNLIEHSDNCSKTSGSLWQFYKDESNDFELFKSKIKITGNTPADRNTKNVEIIVKLKYLSNFWRTLEISLMNWEFNLILTWSSTCVITNPTGYWNKYLSDPKTYALNQYLNHLLIQVSRSKYTFCIMF